jgi:hypothetical protein
MSYSGPTVGLGCIPSAAPAYVATHFGGGTARMYRANTWPDPNSVASTLCGWVKFATDADNYSSFGLTHTSGGEFLGAVARSSNLRVWLTDANFTSSPDDLTLWTYICNVFYGDGSCRIYWTQTPGAEPVSGKFYYLNMTGAFGTINLGSSTQGDSLTGDLAMVGLFEGALTTAQMAAQSNSATALTTAYSFWLLDSQSLTDSSGNGLSLTKTGTITNASSWPI